MTAGKLRPRDGREMCLKFFFACEFSKYHQSNLSGSNTNDESSNEVIFEMSRKLEAFKNAFKASNEVWDFVKKVTLVFIENSVSIDEQLTSQLKNWKLERLSYTDKNILRIALCEILHLDLNPKIAINEALELSKIYSSSDSFSFINGVLDSIVQEKGLKDD